MTSRINPHGIRKMLDCSTGHLDRESRDALRRAAANNRGLLAFNHEYGWFCFVHEDPCDDETPVLRAIWGAAREAGCGWIKFDADGTDHDGLAVFHDWALDEVGLDG